MGKFAVKQPDGQWAMFSTVVDDFVTLDADITQIEAEWGRSIGKFKLCGVECDPYDPDGTLWLDCLQMRSCRWDEPAWTNTTRMICDIIDRANAG